MIFEVLPRSQVTRERSWERLSLSLSLSLSHTHTHSLFLLAVSNIATKSARFFTWENFVCLKQNGAEHQPFWSELWTVSLALSNGCGCQLAHVSLSNRNNGLKFNFLWKKFRKCNFSFFRKTESFHFKSCQKLPKAPRARNFLPVFCQFTSFFTSWPVFYQLTSFFCYLPTWCQFFSEGNLTVGTRVLGLIQPCHFFLTLNWWLSLFSRLIDSS